jgi:hypothetical protein
VLRAAYLLRAACKNPEGTRIAISRGLYVARSKHAARSTQSLFPDSDLSQLRNRLTRDRDHPVTLRADVDQDVRDTETRTGKLQGTDFIAGAHDSAARATRAGRLVPSLEQPFHGAPLSQSVDGANASCICFRPFDTTRDARGWCQSPEFTKPVQLVLIADVQSA